MDNAGTDQARKQKRVERGKAIFKRIEEGFDALADLFEEAHEDGMITINECHRMQNRAMELKCGTLVLHCDATAGADRSGCDVPDPAPVAKPDGGASTRGGPGRRVGP